jgi:hypothetical protein
MKDGRPVVTDWLRYSSRSDSCLHVMKVLEGVTTVEMDEMNGDDDASEDGADGKKLQNSVAGLLARFLPIIEECKLPLQKEYPSFEREGRRSQGRIGDIQRGSRC